MVDDVPVKHGPTARSSHGDLHRIPSSCLERRSSTRTLRGARFVSADLSGVVMRAVDVAGADIDAPWLLDGESRWCVSGVDVVPLAWLST